MARKPETTTGTTTTAKARKPRATKEDKQKAREEALLDRISGIARPLCGGETFTIDGETHPVHVYAIARMASLLDTLWYFADDKPMTRFEMHRARKALIEAAGCEEYESPMGARLIRIAQ